MDETGTLRAFVQRWQIPLIAGAVAVIAGLLAGAYFLWFRQPYAVLFRDLRATDAATIVADLDKRKVPYQLRDGGRAILVPQKLVDTTRLAVMSEELPLKGVVGFELFSKSDMGLTDFAQRINYRRALQGEIARTIMALDEVESARVHLSLSEPSVFREDRRPAKASITIIPRAGRRLSPQSVRGVQRLVAAAVTDLEPSDVVILDESGDVISGSEPMAPAAGASPASQEKAAIEAYYSGRVRQAVAPLASSNQVGVAIAAGWIATSAQGPAPAGDAFANWSPATRAFPLSVTLSSTAPLPPEAKAAIRSAAVQAAGLRLESGDAIYFADTPPPPSVEPAPARVVSLAPAAEAPKAARSPVTSAARQFWIEASLALLAVLGAAAILLHRNGRSRRLSARQRDALAQRLRNLLVEEGDADALARR